MDAYREEKQIVLALIVFSSFILGIISTMLLPRQIIDTVMALQNYRYGNYNQNVQVYAKKHNSAIEEKNSGTERKAVLGVKQTKAASSTKSGNEEPEKSAPVEVNPWTEDIHEVLRDF